jgi:hypothetical protein
MTFWGFVLGAVGAIVAWLATEFIGRPFRRFFDLRSEIARRLVQFDNVSGRMRMVDGTNREYVELSPSQDARLTEAENTFRDLASQMRAFAQAEPIAASIVKRACRYDAWEASRALIAYSNEISTEGPMRAAFKAQIATLLRIKIS